MLLLALLAPEVASTPDGGLRAGAARVDITPSDVDPGSIGDRLYVRAIVIDNGTTRTALPSVDQGSVSETIWAPASRDIAPELGAPAENIVVAATRTHSGGGAVALRVGRASRHQIHTARDRLESDYEGRSPAPPSAGSTT